VGGRDGYWSTKRADATQDQPRQAREYAPIEMPRNSAIGFVNAFFAVVTGFALIWHIWWMAGVGLLGAFVTLLAFAFRDKEEVEIPAAQVAQLDRSRTAEVAL
jgi:cytochrome o ubiquinol oxidase subunit 1